MYQADIFTVFSYIVLGWGGRYSIRIDYTSSLYS